MDQKTPLVFLHGWGTTSGIWQEQINFFSPRWLVLAPDYFCQGPGTLPLSSEPLSLENLAEALFSFCQAQALPYLHLVGWSLGSMIALEFAWRFPSLLRSLTLVAGTPKFISDDSFPYGLPKAELRLLRKRLLQNKLFAFTTFHQLLFTEQEKKREIMLRVRDLFRTNQQISDQRLIESLAILEQADLRPILPDIPSSLPILIIHGENDQVCLPDASSFFHQAFPSSQLVIFPQCGHLPFITYQAKFNQLLDRFLTFLG